MSEKPMNETGSSAAAGSEPVAAPAAEVQQEATAVVTDTQEEAREGPTTEPPAAPSVANAPAASALTQLDVIDGGASSQFARLVRGWETYIHHGTRNVQIGLQNLNLGQCGDGEAANDGSDLLTPIVLRHTYSSPLHYSTMFDDDVSSDMPPPPFLNEMRRSSSTPSTSSAFRERSAGSAFGTNLRAMPNLNGPDDRSAFSLPMHRASYAMSDPGMYSSAFNPYAYPFEIDCMEQTQIEVTDVGTSEGEQQPISAQSAQKQWHAATRARRFLKDNVRGFARRRRHLRGGRENPARPTSLSTKTEEGAGDNETISTKSEGKAVRIQATTAAEEDTKPEAVKTAKAFPPVPQQVAPTMADAPVSPVKGSQYHHLGSDVDEEHDFYQRIETIHDSPITSPVYQRFVDPTESSNPNVRLQVSSPRPTQIRTVNSSESSQSGGDRTSSLDSGAESPGTATSTLTSNTSSNTSGQTTLATNATASSGRSTMLSSVSETDREVMETNKVGRGLRRLNESQGQPKIERDGDGTVHSASTTSTNTHGYLPLVHSPASLRDGANLPSERFFKHSEATTVGSASHHGSASSGDADRHDSETGALPRLESHLAATTVGGSVGNTSSSSSQSADPPTFVSYIDRHPSTDTAKTVARGNVTQSPPLAMVPTAPSAPQDTEERESSPAQILGNSEVIFEAAEPDSQDLFRPVKKRNPKFASRPPLSPIKGLKTPTTPPPGYGHNIARTESSSPGYQQLSPPNIVDHRLLTQPSNLSKPYVLRTVVAPRGMVLVSPDNRDGASNPAVPTTDLEVGRSRTYQESSIEVEKGVMSKQNFAAVVSPEKQAGDSSVSS